ncbi:Protein FAR1-RELATED SEQUENCE [Arachis hypogaea]|nr:Protein FAR1-RELATED SEQUENCE [Arachis hypogaea]
MEGTEEDNLVASTMYCYGNGLFQADDQRDVIILDGIGLFGAIDFDALRAEEIMMIEFVHLKTTYDFYNEFGRIKGFSIRRSKVGRCKKAGSEGDIIWQIFVCSRQGERDAKHVHRNGRKMDPRPVTRCGCNARIKVYVDSRNGRWYVEFFSDEHNQDMLEARFRGMMRSHRAIKMGDLHQINTMRSSGLQVPTIF